MTSQTCPSWCETSNHADDIDTHLLTLGSVGDVTVTIEQLPGERAGVAIYSDGGLLGAVQVAKLLGLLIEARRTLSGIGNR